MRPMGMEAGGESTAAAGCSGEGGRPIDVTRRNRYSGARVEEIEMGVEGGQLVSLG